MGPSYLQHEVGDSRGKGLAYLPWSKGQDTLLSGLFQTPLHWRDPSSPPHLLSTTIYLKYSSYELHANISIRQHSLRILPHRESVPRMRGNNGILGILLIFVKIRSTSTQRHRDDHPQLIGVWGGALVPGKVRVQTGTWWWYRQFSTEARSVCQRTHV